MKLLLALLFVATIDPNRNGIECSTSDEDLSQVISVFYHFDDKLGKTYSNCSVYTSCSECVYTEFPCHWCIETQQCSNDISKSCSSNSVVHSVNSRRYRSGPKFCPTLTRSVDDDEILVEEGARKSITVKISSLLRDSKDSSAFSCQFIIEGRVTNRTAVLLPTNGKIQCESMHFVYTAKSPNCTATLAVFWGGGQIPIGSPVNVVIYRCRDMSHSCSTCLTLPPKYNCGWCKSSATCEFHDQCINVKDKVELLGREETCGGPVIDSFTPNTGPFESVTNITIRGSNLGKRFSDIRSVKVADVNCKPNKNLYVPATRIVCVVDPVDRIYDKEYKRGKVVVQIGESRGESKADYKFVNPEIEDFTPKFGPVSGGTNITITGKHLMTGNRVEAFIDHQQCQILNGGNETHRVCRAPRPAKNQKTGKLTMHFNEFVRDFDGDRFEYVEDPTIEHVSSGSTETNKSPKGIRAGGIHITVVGNHFEAIQRSRMIVTHLNITFPSECQVHSNTTMSCLSPKIDDPYNVDQSDNADKPKYLDYQFEINGVMRPVSNKDQYHSFELYPNPEYSKWDENGRSFEEGKSLVINGLNLNRACSESDVHVMVGSKTCTVTALTREDLTCQPPSEAPDGNLSPIVLVKVGNDLTFDIGVLNYGSVTNGISLFAIVTGSIVLVLLLCVLLILIICYCRHAHDRDTQTGTVPDVHYRANHSERGNENQNSCSGRQTTTSTGQPAISPSRPKNHVYYEVFKR